MKIALASALLLSIAPLSAVAQDHAGQRAEWNRPQQPFRIAGNLYYVGTSELAAYLITDPAGHVLIDVPLAESAPRIAANIEALGFKVRDIRRLLVNHAHWDHADGLAAFKRLSGATLWASAADRATLESGRATDRDDLPQLAPVKVDRILRGGDVVAIGTTRIKAHLTPGHTPGCTSFTLETRDPRISQGRLLKVLLACSMTVAGQRLVNNARYPAAADDFQRSMVRMRSTRPDIFLNFHAGGFDLAAKRARQLDGDAAAFVDPSEWPRRRLQAEQAFQTELARQKAEQPAAR